MDLVGSFFLYKNRSESGKNAAIRVFKVIRILEKHVRVEGYFLDPSGKTEKLPSWFNFHHSFLDLCVKDEEAEKVFNQVENLYRLKLQVFIAGKKLYDEI